MQEQVGCFRLKVKLLKKRTALLDDPTDIVKDKQHIDSDAKVLVETKFRCFEEYYLSRHIL